MSGRVIASIAAGDVEDGDSVVVADSVRVVRMGGCVYAFSNVCTHRKSNLGKIRGEKVECPLHGALFDVKTGEVLRGPAVVPLRCHRVEESDGQIRVMEDE